MKGDFSRLTFDATKHFSRVLNQQGRVTLDADSNEQSEILLHILRTMASDLFGPYGGPTDANGGGFGLQLVQQPGTVGWRLAIGAGHYYVDGILCESDGCDFAGQPVYGPPGTDFQSGDSALLEWLKKPVADQPFWVYLDVWERHVTAIEDDSIREVALGAGSPDTCTRSKVIWQVKALPWDKAWGTKFACGDPLRFFDGKGTARMAAQLAQGVQITDPCVIAPGAKYRGAENQLYRVEIHDAGAAGTATFKWSRDNGSVATRWLGSDLGPEKSDLIVANARGFDAGTWVELSDDALDLAGKQGVMVRTTKVEGDRLSVDPDSASGPIVWSAQRTNPKVRRWDQRENDNVTLTHGAVPVGESADAAHPTWIDLEDGVQIEFEQGGQYRTGDYWLIPARVATGNIEWAPDAAGGLLKAPFGIHHHYAPLGVLRLTAGAEVPDALESCRVCLERRVVSCAAAAPQSARDDPLAPLDATVTAPASARPKRARKKSPA